MNRLVRSIAPVIALAIVGGAMAQPKRVDGVITDERGMSLYWWNNDAPGSGKSVCSGPCTLSWPPMIAKGDAVPSGDFSLINRDDGAKQWAHKGWPLYLWINDSKPGDKTGDGFPTGSGICPSRTSNLGVLHVIQDRGSWEVDVRQPGHSGQTARAPSAVLLVPAAGTLAATRQRATRKNWPGGQRFSSMPRYGTEAPSSSQGFSRDPLLIHESIAMKNSVVIAAVLLALMGGVAQAQTAAPAAAPAKTAPAKAAVASTDPIVVMRAEQRAARSAFTETTRPIRAERAATVKAAEDKAMADAKAAGKDPLVARRNANRAAMAATRADFEAKMKDATVTRDAALAAATAKRNAAGK